LQRKPEFCGLANPAGLERSFRFQVRTQFDFAGDHFHLPLPDLESGFVQGDGVFPDIQLENLGRGAHELAVDINFGAGGIRSDRNF